MTLAADIDDRDIDRSSRLVDNPASDVPVVGRLFTSEQFQRNETELVIIVTPYVVRAVSSSA